MTDLEINEAVNRCNKMLDVITKTPGKLTVGIGVTADLCRTVLSMADVIHTLKDKVRRESRYRKGYFKENTDEHIHTGS
jgi:hypothetical protein